MDTDIMVRLENHEQRLNVIENEIRELAQNGKDIQSLTIMMHEISDQLGFIKDETVRQGKRLEKIESAPANSWKSVKQTILNTFISVISSALAIGVIFLIAQNIK